MKRVLELLLFSLTTYGLLMLCSCEKQEDIIEEEITPISFEEDPLYGRLNNNSTIEEYIEVFLEDAERHGYDTSIITSIKVDWGKEPMYKVPDAGSYSALDPTRIHIIFQKSTWDALNFDGTYVDDRKARESYYLRPDEYIPYYKLKVIYHELGHCVFGWGHTCEPGHIMTDNEPCGRLWGVPNDPTGLFNLASLQYSHEDELLDWHRAVDDIFSGREQVSLR